MSVKKIVNPQRSDIQEKLNKKNIKKSKNKIKEEQLSFHDILDLMKHDSYYRHRGAIRQR
ncbi:hypothetical protein [Clostridium scatologenes]|uniref:Uncharacterized protein n=1 Tax=Clostridium scatologenes TaxID=1548 RepID=A0A0E3M9P7_CLOSL|nr:hypothetical protein [Clostridium scatologenes]AKA69850.1 hypothetical protein CSCA_2725 [Clostridium scatologenes]